MPTRTWKRGGKKIVQNLTNRWERGGINGGGGVLKNCSKLNKGVTNLMTGVEWRKFSDTTK